VFIVERANWLLEPWHAQVSWMRAVHCCEPVALEQNELEDEANGTIGERTGRK